MEKLKFWKIQKGDETTAKRLKESLDNIYDRMPKGYDFDLTDKEVDFSLNQRYNVHFVIGNDLDHILGYANCVQSNPVKDISKISRLNGFDSSSQLFDCNGKPVTRETLVNYPGYNQYTGKGKVLHIDKMEVFLRREGIGTKLMKSIKLQGYELIELEAYTEEAVQFYESNSFIDTGIDSNKGKFLVMAWNNPRFDLR